MIKHLSVVRAGWTRGRGAVLARARRINACWTNPILARRPVRARPSLSIGDCIRARGQHLDRRAANEETDRGR